MNPILYVKSHGIKGTWDIIYRYKMNQVLRKFAIKITAHKPLQDTIVIESHNDFDSNGGAFYDYLIKNQYNDKYKIVWLLKNKQPDHLPKNVSAFYLYKPSLKKQMMICTAKYILTCQDAIGSVREGQISVYLGHGAFGLKSVKGVLNLPSNLTYCLIPSMQLKKMMISEFSLSSNVQAVDIGYPEYDLLYDNSRTGDLKKITTKSYQKMILWMPTFRKGQAFGRNDSLKEEPLGIPIFNNEVEIKQLNKRLQEGRALLIIKIHPKQDSRYIKVKGLSNIKVLDQNEVKRLRISNPLLMKDADGLISDYSASAYDYLHLDRPIGYTVDDLKEYKRGFKVEDIYDWMGGQIIHNVEDFLDFINTILNNKDPYKDKRHEVFEKVFTYHDGKSSDRLASMLKLKQQEVY